ncbi:hypothetical protein KM043_002178 [Ampulex compressa]|nr:hypothetical protein KM043_002178 [Ampulex compressa]
MTPRIDRFFLALCLLCVAEFCFAIVNPALITTKPPKRREQVLPWYSDGEHHEPAEEVAVSSTPKVRTLAPIGEKPAKTKSWSSWRKAPGSEIEQRTEISGDPQADSVPYQAKPDWVEVHDLDYNQYEQRENAKVPGKQYDDRRQDGGKDDVGYQEEEEDDECSEESGEEEDEDQGLYEGGPDDSTKPHKEKIVSTKPRSTVARHDPRLGYQCPEPDSTGQFVYPPDCKFFVNCWKGRAFVQACAPGTNFNPETLECDFPHKVKCFNQNVAGVSSHDHSDHSGRREPSLAGAASQHVPEKLQEPKCPPQLTGLLPHPTECTKFLQCANGGTYIMDCGPGTVFNPANSVCDWPLNVKGCEDALKSKEETERPLTPPSSNLHSDKRLGYSEPAKKIACPPDFTGLLPHPETCKKFLQCANGITYIMDCGPGTAFNPQTTVCDWPYNVPGCSEDKPRTTTFKPTWRPNVWTTPSPPYNAPDYHDRHDPGHRNEYHQPHGQNRHDGHAYDHRDPSSGNFGRPRTDPRPEARWPKEHGTEDRDGRPHAGQGYQEGRGHRPHEHRPGSRHYHHHHGRTFESDDDRVNRHPEIPRDHRHQHDTSEEDPRQEAGGRQPGPDRHPGYDHRYKPQGKPRLPTQPWNPAHPGSGGSDVQRPQVPYDESQTNEPHYPGQYDRDAYDRHPSRNQTRSQPWNPHYIPLGGTNDQRPRVPYDESQTNEPHYPGQYDRDAYDRHPSRNQTRSQPWSPDNRGSGGSDVQRPQVPYDESQTNEPHYPGQYDRVPYDRHPPRNQTRSQPWTPYYTSPGGSKDPRTQVSYDESQTNEPHYPGQYDRVSYDRHPPRNQTRSQPWTPYYTPPGEPSVQGPQVPYDESQTNEGFYPGEFDRDGYDRHPPQNRTRWHEGNLPPNRRIGHELIPNRQEYGRANSELPYSNWNRTTQGAFKPGGWNGQQGPGNGREELGPEEPLSWNQGTISPQDKLHKWESGSPVYEQSTADREADAKFDHWASRTNVFEQAKGQKKPGLKNTPQGSTYPSGIYVNANGTRGHFIVKEIEVNQGHSKTQVFGPNSPQTSKEFNRTSDGYYPALPPPKNHPVTHVVIQPSIELEPPYYDQDRLPPDNGVLTTQAKLDPTSTINDPSILPPSINLEPPEPEIFPSYHVPIVQSPRNSSSNRNLLLPNPPYKHPQQTHFKPDEVQRPSFDLQPPDPPNTDGTPSIHLLPPYPESEPTYYYSSTTQRAPDKVLFVLSKKQPAQDNSSRRPNDPSVVPNVPSVSIDYDGDDSSDESSEDTDTSPSTSTPRTVPYPFYPTPFNRTNNRPLHKRPRQLRPNSSTQSPNLGSSFVPSTTRTPATSPPQGSKPLKPEPAGGIGYPSTTERGLSSSDRDSKLGRKTKEEPEVPIIEVVEPNIRDYDVDVLDKKDGWKPTLVFENKTKKPDGPSVIMKINKEDVDVELFNIEAPPFKEEEPPFPVYYVPPVKPITHSKKSAPLTPNSGQVIRLRGGSGPADGYVEVQGAQPGWGVVCDSRNSWTLKEAHVVCKQLGYPRGAEMAWQGRNNRDGVPTWIAANSVTCLGNETRFQSCKFSHDQECRVERDAIGVRCTANRVAHCRKDEVPHEGQCYHLADTGIGLNHAEALEYCAQRQARLIDITTQAENDFVSEWLLQMHPEVGSIMTSGVGFTTLGRAFWLWEDSGRAKFRFKKWWPGWMGDRKLPPAIESSPKCVVMKRKFPCHDQANSLCVADYFFWDIDDCKTTTKDHFYICERPYDNIGCVYGKGNQYTGKANVTMTGKDCLSWGDDQVAHHLLVNVVNQDTREKLKTHNYCRNPNSLKESRPWCFTGPHGEYEYCDIPSCSNLGFEKAPIGGQCKPKHFECLPGECIPSRWVCDGDEDCTNGADEVACSLHLNLFQKYARKKLEGYDVEKWVNTPLKTCALKCKEAVFTCRSFAHNSDKNICLLSDRNIGMTGSLNPNTEFDYYEMKERKLNCTGMYVCANQKCINESQVCDGKNDCNDRSDENVCSAQNLDYAIRLAGAKNSHEGRVEVKILGVWGQVCDDGFGMINADVICKELGFTLGALEVRPGGFYGNLDPPTRFMVDQLKCRGNETTLRECDFDGWGVHNCQPEEAVGVICKTAVESCQEGHWKCDKSPTCIRTAFICDEVVDCPDGSDESPKHCDAPFEIRLVNGSSRLQGRVEVRHHGIWGTVCDDDFSSATAAVICRSLGYGGKAIAKKDGFFGAGQGPIWLDEVSCHGNESQLYRCEHNDWGQHNCDHNEDAGVICTPGNVNDSKHRWETTTPVADVDVNDLLPADCGKRFEDFNEDEDLIFAKVVQGSVAPKGSYPWQASIRIRGHSRSSHWCGAVILSPLHVLTAAHCLQGYNKGMYFVRAGDYNTEITEGTEVEANIEDYYVHEEFRKGHRMNNDIALVLLKGRGIPLGRDIMPICLPPENAEYPSGLNCTISGFGSIETGKSTQSKDLRYGWIPLLDQSVCRAGHIYGEGAISDGMVCAGHLDEGVDTCDGDSGGPLACYHNGAFTLYGITSWGQHCGKANKPGVYVRVAYYRRWIDQKIRESLSGR